MEETTTFFTQKEEGYICEKKGHDEGELLRICTHAYPCKDRLLCFVCGMEHAQQYSSHKPKNNIPIKQFLQKIDNLYETLTTTPDQPMTQTKDFEQINKNIDKFFASLKNSINKSLDQAQETLKKEIKVQTDQFVQNSTLSEEDLAKIKSYKGKDLKELDPKELDNFMKMLNSSQFNPLKTVQDKVTRILNRIDNDFEKVDLKIKFQLPKQGPNEVQERSLVKVQSAKDHNVSISINYGKVTQDSSSQVDSETIYRIDNFQSQGSIYVYNNFDSLKDQDYETLPIKTQFCGSYWTIHNGHLYAQGSPYTSNNIICINLETGDQVETRAIKSAKAGGGTNQWGGYNDFYFYSDESSIYVLYQSTKKNNMVIEEIQAETLEKINSWTINAQKVSYGGAFMIDKILYFISGYSAQPAQINLVYSLRDSKDITRDNKAKSYPNTGGYDTSCHFNPKTNQLWTINNTKFYTYEVKLE